MTKKRGRGPQTEEDRDTKRRKLSPSPFETCAMCGALGHRPTLSEPEEDALKASTSTRVEQCLRLLVGKPGKGSYYIGPIEPRGGVYLALPDGEWRKETSPQAMIKGYILHFNPAENEGTCPVTACLRMRVLMDRLNGTEIQGPQDQGGHWALTSRTATWDGVNCPGVARFVWKIGTQSFFIYHVNRVPRPLTVTTVSSDSSTFTIGPCRRGPSLIEDVDVSLAPYRDTSTSEVFDLLTVCRLQYVEGDP